MRLSLFLIDAGVGVGDGVEKVHRKLAGAFRQRPLRMTHRVPHGLHAHPWALRSRPGGQRYQLRRTRGDLHQLPLRLSAADVVLAAVHPMDWDARLLHGPAIEATPPWMVAPSHTWPAVPCLRVEAIPHWLVALTHVNVGIFLYPNYLGAPTPPENGSALAEPSTH